jgi:hypothetical protein
MMARYVHWSLIFVAFFATYKLAVAPRQGKWLTLFGHVSKTDKPNLFWTCWGVGAVLILLVIVALISEEDWMPLFFSDPL